MIMIASTSLHYVFMQLPNILLQNGVSAASSQISLAIGRLSIFASCALEPSPSPLPPRLVFLASMWHALPYLRLATIIHTRPRSTPTPRPSTPFHYTPPSCTPCVYLLIKRKRGPRCHRISSPVTLDACATRRGWCSGTRVRAHRSLTAAFAVACLSRRRPLEVVVRVWIFPGEFALEAPQRCFRKSFYCIRILPLDAPVDVWV